MKILHINNADTKGGAARAGLALNKALQKMGVKSKMLVQSKYGEDSTVFPIDQDPVNSILTLFRKGIDFFTIEMLTKKQRGRFSFPLIGRDISNHTLVKEADILHFHWINEGFLSLGSIRKLLKLNKPIVWTLHDMWAFTGGCHYDGGCNNFTTRCDKCPSLKIKRNNDCSSTIFARKINLYKDFNPSIITCSKWLAGEAEKSILLGDKDIRSIPNPIDIKLFKPTDKRKARERFGISPQKIQILFATMTLKEERKGFEYFKYSLIELAKRDKTYKDKIELVVMGAADKSSNDKFPFSVKYIGRLDDDKSIVDCYNSADIFAAPSLQDNLPNTVMESLSCGIPVVAFNIGGMPEMVAHKMNGYLAQEKSVEDFANGLEFLVKEKDNLNEFSKSAREVVLNSFTEEIVTKKYIELYKSLS